MASGWQQWTERVARAEIAAWQQSGLVPEKFAKGRGYSSRRIRYWRDRLEAGGRSMRYPTQTGALVVDKRPALVPVRIMERPAAPTAIEIGLQCGLVVRVQGTFETAAVVALVRALEAAC